MLIDLKQLSNSNICSYFKLNSMIFLSLKLFLFPIAKERSTKIKLKRL